MGAYNFTTLVGFPSGTYGGEAFGINDAGQIVGAYVDANHLMHGYIYSNGTYTIIDDPLAGTNGPYPQSGGSTGGTQAFGINNSGQIVGEYFDSDGALHGFSYSSGAYTTLDAPQGGGTYASAINSSGQIVGLYFGEPNGFLYSNGAYTTLPTYLSGYYQVTGINDAGQIVGMTYSGGLPNAFLYSNGVFTSLSDPLGTNGTAAVAINNNGQIVGYYLDSSNVQHGFVYSDGIYTTIDDPLGTHGTVLTGINDLGEVVGYYLDNSSLGQIGGLISDFQSGIHYAFTATLRPLVTITSAGGLTNQATQTISGTVDVVDGGTTVSLYDNGASTPIGTAVVQPGLDNTRVVFSGADATFYEVENNWAPSQMIDGIFTGPSGPGTLGGINGWSVYNYATGVSEAADALLLISP